MPPTPTSSGSRPRPRTSTRPASSPPPSTPSSPGSSWPTTARPASTGAARWTRRRSRRSRRSSAPSGTASSLSRWPGSTRSTTGCSSWLRRTARGAWPRTRSCRRYGIVFLSFPPLPFFFFWISSSLGSFPLVLPSFSSHFFQSLPPPPKNSKRKRKPFVGRVRLRGSRLHRDQAPARGRHGLLRRRVDGRERRRFVDARAQGLDRGGAVPLGIAPLSWLFGLCFLLESTIERHRNESFFIGKKGSERRGRERKNLYVFSF